MAQMDCEPQMQLLKDKTKQIPGDCLLYLESLTGPHGITPRWTSFNWTKL